MAMNPAMLAALQSKNPVLAHLVRIELPDKTIRLVDGSGYVSWGSEVFTGRDSEFGSIAGFGDFLETEGTESPRQEISLLVPNNAALSTLTSPAVQGSTVSIYAATIARDTGAIIGAPDARFIGQIDDANVNFGKNGSILTIELSTVWELLFDNNEGNRWNDTYWTYLYGSNARAFDGVVNVSKRMYWGYFGPKNSSGGSYGGGSGSIGGDFGSIGSPNVVIR